MALCVCALAVCEGHTAPVLLQCAVGAAAAGLAVLLLPADDALL